MKKHTFHWGSIIGDYIENINDIFKINSILTIHAPSYNNGTISEMVRYNFY